MLLRVLRNAPEQSGFNQRSHRPVAIANYDFRAAGTVKKSIEIAAGAIQAGMEAELWVARAMGPFLSQVPDSIPVVEFGSRWLRTASRGADLATSIPALAATLRDRRPSVLLSAGNHFHLAARSALRLAACEEIRLGVRASNSSIRSAMPDAPRPMRWIDRAKYEGADFIVAVSHELSIEVASAVTGKPVTCISNAVDVDHVQALAREAFEHRFLDERTQGRAGPLIVSMGRLGRQKGFDILLHAFAGLPEVFGARLLIIGSGSDAQHSGLAALAQQLGIAAKVDFTGFMENPFRAMARADLYVSASRWEGASNALVEALACGLPIACTDCPTGQCEIIAHGEFGTLARSEDSLSLRTAIIEELAKRRCRDTQREHARSFGFNQYAEKWVALLRAEQRKTERNFEGTAF